MGQIKPKTPQFRFYFFAIFHFLCSGILLPWKERIFFLDGVSFVWLLYKGWSCFNQDQFLFYFYSKNWNFWIIAITKIWQNDSNNSEAMKLRKMKIKPRICIYLIVSKSYTSNISTQSKQFLECTCIPSEKISHICYSNRIAQTPFSSFFYFFF